MAGGCRAWASGGACQGAIVSLLSAQTMCISLEVSDLSEKEGAKILAGTCPFLFAL
jgi:hypothetical protein